MSVDKSVQNHPSSLLLSQVLFSPKIPIHATQEALTDGVRSVSWQQLHHHCLSLASMMRVDLSLMESQHIALLIGNRAEFIELMLAGVIAGVWITPVNTHLQPEEVLYIIEDSDARVLFYDNEHEHLIAGFAHKDNQDCLFINIESFYQSMSASASERDVDVVDKLFPLSGPAGGTMLYTSGTTGKPKGVKRNKPDSLAEALEKMRAGGLMFGLEGNGPHLVTGPLYHAAPMLFALYDLLNGAPMVIMPKWSNEAFVNLVQRYSIRSTHLVPTMFVRLLNDAAIRESDADFSSLALVLHGAAPIAKVTKQQMLDWWGHILVEYWGGTEAGVTTMVTSEQWIDHPGTVGKPLPHFDVFVGNENGCPLTSEANAKSAEGLLFCRHHVLPQVFEYHHDPLKTQKSHPKPYTFCIGDIGYVEDGYVYLSDRESNMIISGGVNIYPLEVEHALLEHEAIADVAVFGVPNLEWGEEVKAAVQLNAGFEESDSLKVQLIQHARQKVANYKAPRSIVFEASLPRTPTGKLQVRLLKQKYQ